MCHFVTASIPRSADTPRFRRLVEDHGLAFEPLSNAAVQRFLRPDEAYFRATRGYCDCGTCLVRGGGSQTKAGDRKLRELRRRGWSETKIGRWLESTDPAAKDRGTRPTQDEWRTFIVAALESGVPCVSLLVHWYAHGLSDESIEIQRRAIVEPTALPLAGGFEEDVLYTFALAGPRDE